MEKPVVNISGSTIRSGAAGLLQQPLEMLEVGLAVVPGQGGLDQGDIQVRQCRQITHSFSAACRSVSSRFGKTQAHQALALRWALVEHRDRDGRHAMLAGHPQGHGDVIQVRAYL